ncbi:peroxiredoxin [Dyella caseinilytica]|uniref:thioredoxin-dependent peroxiredoxin n=1 Tax=Dyella caseinilytica TaxID=1849581 RepID=A0ABX7GYS1_9GAMM|nr:peroxiredoxin [Dyella caseinilytica]QRN55657.1 peroxiredoxin [Dyella caseinilytica]GGA03483.1 peroxiredoxin [Dyella caseinilytica]
MKNPSKWLLAAGATTAVLLAAPAIAALAPGTAAPDFTAQASLAGKDFTFSLKDALKKGPVVVYFYPSAYTGGCDIEAHTFATDKAKFDAAGATIIGVSADSLDRLNTFSSDPSYCAGKFPVASDTTGKIAASYDLKVEAAQAGVTDVRGVAINHAFISRTTFVINRDGKIVATLSSEADHLHPEDHVKKSLAIVQQLQAGKAP